MTRSKITLFTFIIVSLVLFVSQANAGYKLPISTEGTHYLTAHLDCTDGSSGIIINANNVTIDGNGFKIIGAGSGNGIYAYNRSNIVIQNCTVENFNLNIYLRKISDGEIIGNTIDITNIGIYLRDSSNFEIMDNTVTSSSGRAMHLRNSSDCIIEDNNVVDSDVFGITIAGSSATGNTITHNNIKNCEKKTASDSARNNTWDSNYYDDAVDWDCDGTTLYPIGEFAADYNAYVDENGWDAPLTTYVDEDGDGYGVDCPLGTDINDHTSMINVYKEKVFNNFEDGDLGWQYICRPWWPPGACDNVSISILPYITSFGHRMELEITEIDTTGFNYSQYIDIFYGEEGMNWTRYHTMTFWVYPVNTERPTTHLHVRIDNDLMCGNDIPYPNTLFEDECREIQKSIHLVSNNWNKVILDLDLDDYAGGIYTPGDPRPTTLDNIKNVRFFIPRDPKYFEDEQDVTFYIDDIRLLRDSKGKK